MLNELLRHGMDGYRFFPLGVLRKSEMATKIGYRIFLGLFQALVLPTENAIG
jgi:hypothetical protein